MPTYKASNSTNLLSRLASNTWERIRLSNIYSVSQGEETITDVNLLEIAMLGLNFIKIWKCPKTQESIKGIDWDFFIGSPSSGWMRYAIQAKKLDLASNTYKNLGHEVIQKKGASIPQINVLEKYSAKNNSIPLYCFYNYTTKINLSTHWRCCSESVDTSQFGCTITPSSVIKSAPKYGGRTFNYIHKQQETIPWRCLACPNSRSHMPVFDAFSIRLGHGKKGYHSHLPPHVHLMMLGESQALQQVELAYIETERGRFPIVPRRIAVINLDDDTDDTVGIPTF